MRKKYLLPTALKQINTGKSPHFKVKIGAEALYLKLVGTSHVENLHHSALPYKLFWASRSNAAMGDMSSGSSLPFFSDGLLQEVIFVFEHFLELAQLHLSLF